MFPWNLFPFNEDMMKKFKTMQPENIEKYVQQMINEMIPKERQQMQWMTNQQANKTEETTQLKHTVFQTHEDIYVIIPIKDRQTVQDLKIFHTANELIIDHIEGKQSISLPSLVRKKGARAIYKDGLLEIKIPRSVDRQISEISIRNED